MSNSNWRSYKLEELGFVGRGKSKRRPRNDPSLYGGPYPFVQTGDIKSANLYLREHTQTYSEIGLAQSKLWNPGTLCITIAANIAETAILGIKACFPDSVIGFIADPTKSDVRFIKYYVDYIKLRIQNVSQGTTQDNLSMEKLRAFDFIVPGIELQREIANVLSAYDDLIENNTRRIAILEEMAQALYREWFVHFRFPGHESVALVENGNGRLPEGWEVRPLGDACNSIKDGDWIETKDQGGEDYRLLQVSNIGQGEFVETGNYRFITQETFDHLRCQEIIPGDILVSRMPRPTGRAWLVTDMPFRMVTAVDVAIIKTNPDKADPVFLTYLMNSQSHLDLVEKHQTGTTRPRISRRNLTALQIIIPPLNEQKRFAEFAGKNYELITNLRKKNVNLRQTRDLLLPRLISGELDVSRIAAPSAR